MMDTLMHRGLARIFLIEEEHRLVLAEAEMEWVRDLAGEISNGTLDGIELWKSIHGGGGARTT
jgi:hypothetical protein